MKPKELYLTDFSLWELLLNKDYKNIRVLSFQTTGRVAPYGLSDCQDVLKKRGFSLKIVNLENKTQEENFINTVSATLDFRPHIVLTIDTVGLVPQIFNILGGIVYISWFFDNAKNFIIPSVYLNPPSPYYYLFCWEKNNISLFKEKNLAHVSYLPYGINENVFYNQNQESSEFSSIISFVGNSLNQNRREIIQAVSQKYSIDVYGDPGWKEIENNNLKYKGEVTNRKELSLIYSSSKINLNISPPQAETAISERIFNILGSGGFLISDYKAGIENLFSLNKEVVCYKNKKELLPLIEFYLKENEKRLLIAKNGEKKVRSTHLISQKIDIILNNIKENRPAPKDIENFYHELESNKVYANPFSQLGVIFAGRKEYQTAFKCFKKALTIDPKNQLALQNLEQLNKLINNSLGI